MLSLYAVNASDSAKCIISIRNQLFSQRKKKNQTPKYNKAIELILILTEKICKRTPNSIPAICSSIGNLPGQAEGQGLSMYGLMSW